MTAVELQFTEAGALGAYVQALLTAGKTVSMVVPLSNKSWYLIIHS